MYAWPAPVREQPYPCLGLLESPWLYSCRYRRAAEGTKDMCRHYIAGYPITTSAACSALSIGVIKGLHIGVLGMWARIISSQKYQGAQNENRLLVTVARPL